MPVARPLHLRCQSLLLHHLFQFVGPETSSRSFQVSASKKLKSWLYLLHLIDETKVCLAIAAQKNDSRSTPPTSPREKETHPSDGSLVLASWSWTSLPAFSLGFAGHLRVNVQNKQTSNQDKSCHGKANSAKTPVPWLAAQ